MLVKHTIKEEDALVQYTYIAECICDRCHRRFYHETEPFESDIHDEIEIEFLKKDFSLCWDCKNIIDKIKKRQMCLI